MNFLWFIELRIVVGVLALFFSGSLLAFGTISASRTFVNASGPETHSIHLSWYAPGEGVVQVWVDKNGQGEKLMSQGKADSYTTKEVPWIQGPENEYKFLLYKGTERAQLLDEIAVSTGMHMPNNKSLYLSVPSDTYVDGSKVLLSTDLNLNQSKAVYVHSDGRYFPFGGLGEASVSIRIDGRTISNESLINWDGSSAARQHSYNAIGLTELAAGVHKIELIAEGSTFKVGAGANLSVLVNPAPISQVRTLGSRSNTINIDTSNWSAKNGDPHQTQNLFGNVLSSDLIYLDKEPAVALSSGVAKYAGAYGDAMWSLGIDGVFPGSDVALSSVNDIYKGAELVAPMYSHAYFDHSYVGLQNSIDFLAGEFPWKSSNPNSQNLKYRVDAGAKLIVLGGGLSVSGSTTTNGHNASRLFHQWEYYRIGGYAPEPPTWIDHTKEIASQEIVIPPGHNGIVMFSAKSRIQADTDDAYQGIGTTSLWITIDGKRMGSRGVQQISYPNGVSQRTLSASYLASGANSLSVGAHTVKVYMRAQGDMKWPSTHKEATLIWFD